MIEALDTAIKRKLITILNKSSFFSLLSDRSEAKKTGDDKEMVLAKTCYKGVQEFLNSQLFCFFIERDWLSIFLSQINSKKYIFITLT